MTGDPIDAARALSWRLVSKVLELSPRALALAQTIAARTPLAVETAKTNLRTAYAMPLKTAVRHEWDLQTI
jgi:enoyl-CoA hydratase/carnithine racemase